MMKEKTKSYIIILFSVIVTLIMSANIIVNAEYDEYGNYYDPYEYSESSVFEDYSSADTSELTSEDWAELQESLNSSFQASLNSGNNSNNKSDFQNIKEDSNPNDDVNDAWWYMLIGLLLIVIGVTIIVLVIAATIRFKHSVQPQQNKKNPPKPTKK